MKIAKYIKCTAIESLVVLNGLLQIDWRYSTVSSCVPGRSVDKESLSFHKVLHDLEM